MKILPLLALFLIGSPALAQDRIVTVKVRGGSHPFYFYQTRKFNCTKNLFKTDQQSGMIYKPGKWESPNDYKGESKAMAQSIMNYHCNK